MYSTDRNGKRSAPVVFPVVLSKGITSKVENLFIPPTIQADKIQVTPSEPVTLFGQTTPYATVEVTLGNRTNTTSVGSDGMYRYQVETVGLPRGEYTAVARAVQGQIRSGVSDSLTVTIGDKTVSPAVKDDCAIRGDLNNDCRVNLVDFSILAFWLERPLTPEVIIREKEHLSGDGKINLIDFSIMAFHWTG